MAGIDLPSNHLSSGHMKPAFHLLVPDQALREALVEQLNLAALGVVQEAASFPAAASTDPLVVIVDESAWDAKTNKKLCSIKNDGCTIVLLGDPPPDVDDELMAEAFSKPLRLGHLIGRLRFYIEVAPKLRNTPIAIGVYKLEVQQRSLTCGNEIVRLTEKETALLEYLAQSANPVGREELLANVWGYDARIDTHTLETHIYQLRRKLGNELILIEGGQYRLAK